MTDTTGLDSLPQSARWRLAARLKTLPLSQTPVLAGTWAAVAGGHGWRLDVTFAALISAGAIQLGTNLWNDAADAARGVDTPERLGPPRMTALGLLAPEAVRRAALATFGLAAAAGLWLVLLGGWPVLAIGLASLALGYLYSMGPRPLSGLPVGEALVIVFFGLIPVSTIAWLQGADPLAPRLVALGLMIGLPAAAVLMLNNHRDRVQDAAGGRRTLAILLGPGPSRLAYGLALLGAVALAGWLTGAAWPAWLAGAAALALSAAMLRWPISPRLNRLIGMTALFQAGLLLAVVLS